MIRKYKKQINPKLYLTMQLPIQIDYTIFDEDISENKRTIKIPENGFVTLIGPNGSGKSHLLRGLARHCQKHNNSLLAGKTVRYLPSARLIDPSTMPDEESDGSLALDYQALQERADIRLKVRARLRESFKRDIHLQWTTKGLEVDFEHEKIPDNLSQKLEYSISKEASGLVQLVGLMSALYNEEIGLLVIDEPELSLHPQYQNFLLDEIRKVSGAPSNNSNYKIIIIATHSPEFIRFNDLKKDLPSFCLCDTVDQNPLQVLEFDYEFEDNNLLQRISYQYKKALFAESVLLVEGDTDEMICRALANRKNLELETCGIQLVSVGSKEDFYSAISFFRAIQKTVNVLADVDWLVDRPSDVERFFGRDLKLAKKTNDIFNTPWEDYAEMLRFFRNHSYGYGRFRRILDYIETNLLTEKNLTTHQILTKIEKQVNKILDRNEFNSFSTALSRVSFCKLIENPAHPMQATLDELENRGAFVIRTGELESNYTTKRVNKKRVWAMREYRAIMEYSIAKITRHYGDILRCLEYSTPDKEHTELNMLHNSITMLAMELHNYFYKRQDDEIKRTIYRVNKEGIFHLVWEMENMLIRIQLGSALFAIRDLNITLLEQDDINITKHKIDNVFREYGLPLTRAVLHEC